MGFLNLFVGGLIVGIFWVIYFGIIVVRLDVFVIGFSFVFVFGIKMGFLNLLVFGYMMYGLLNISVGGDGVGFVWVMYCGIKDIVFLKLFVIGLWNWFVNGVKIGWSKSLVIGIFSVKKVVVGWVFAGDFVVIVDKFEEEIKIVVLFSLYIRWI